MTFIYSRHAGKTCAELDSVSVAKRNKFYPASPKSNNRSQFKKPKMTPLQRKMSPFATNFFRSRTVKLVQTPVPLSADCYLANASKPPQK